jgi:predicted DNA-binding transcriptional regulator AlpA
MKNLGNQTDNRAKWLRSKNVREMLGISDSTLQTLRINGTIPTYKLGASWFYKEEEILQILETNKLRIGGKSDE